MAESIAVDLLPEFRPLAIESSNLMLAANSHWAKGESAEAVASFVAAARVCASLATRLLTDGFLEEAAQDFDIAASCCRDAALVATEAAAEREVERGRRIRVGCGMR